MSNPATMEIKTIGSETGRTGKKEALKRIFKKQEYIERGQGLKGGGRRMADTGQNKQNRAQPSHHLDIQINGLRCKLISYGLDPLPSSVNNV